ncbi:zeta toxin family protein [Neptunicella sp.]|uniref:zeta toxin family protein n=1 Tax=Neptunicella sp. TaxID=2125986 RepID=UPI003F68F0C2
MIPSVSVKVTEDEKRIEENAIKFAKNNRTSIANELTDLEQYPTDEEPVSVFMAGSLRAGKTEASKAFLEELKAENVIRIDPDELREHFENYHRDNSYLFQKSSLLLSNVRLIKRLNGISHFC